jgi:hypothetical protein
MNKNLTRTLMATMIGATVLTPVAYGQTAVQFFEQEEYCLALEALVVEETDRLRPDWVEETRPVIAAAVDTDCLVYYEQATAALAPDAAEVDAEAAARIVVMQPDPQVAVQQRAPLVSVTQQEPRVRINQGQPQIVVRQAAPNVRVQIPQPIITIDQPQPEIIVTMPEPDVAITNPEPQVEVQLREPEINVSQGEPQVAVRATEATTEAQVQLQQQQPEVEVVGTGSEAQVSVQQEEPTVLYEPAEPNIMVEEQGEPEIRFNQTGEPNIVFEEAGAGVAAGAVATDVDIERANLMLAQETEMVAGQAMPYNVVDVVGRGLTNARGEELGTIDRVVLQGNREYLVLTDGGFLGMGEREVAIPLDTVSVMEGNLVTRGMAAEDIEAMPEFDSVNAQVIGDNELIEIGTP